MSVRSIVRALAGPALLALAAWLASGTLSTTSPSSSSIRFVILGSALVPAIVFAAALALPALRRRPVLALPAVLAVIPWLPIPIPDEALLWTGRLAWIPVAIPFLAAGFAHASTWQRPASPAASTPVWHLACSLVLTITLAASAAYALRWSLPMGDEPHYLVITQSLLNDGDLRIENNHQQRDYVSYYAQTIDPQSLRRGLDGQIYPVHLPGVSILVLPFFAVFGYPGAQAAIVLMAGLTGALVWWIGWRATGDRAAAWFAWAAIACSATFLTESVAIFPDMPGALGCAIAVLAATSLVTDRWPRAASVLVAASALALLPFLHARFAILSGGLGLMILILLMRVRPPATSLVRYRALSCFVAPSVIGLIAWLGYFWIIYGSFDPRAPYGTAPETSALNVPGGLMGLAFDQQFGLLAYTPVFAAAFLQPFDRRLRGSWLSTSLLAVGLAYAAGVATYWMWWAGGPAAPARFITAALPLFAVALACLRHGATSGQRTLLGVLLAVSAAIGILTTAGGDGSLFANERDGRALWLDWLASPLDLPRLWPSFFWQLDVSNRASLWSFVSHALIWIAVFGTSGVWLWRRLASDTARPASTSSLVLAAFWLPLALTTSVALSSAAKDIRPLRPGISQLDVLWRSAHGESAYVIAPGVVSAMSESTAVRIEVPRVEAPDAQRAEWLVLPQVPAGRYQLTVRPSRPIDGGILEVRQGRSPTPLAVLPLTRQSSQSFLLELPADTRALWLVPNDILGTTRGTISIERERSR